MKITRLICSLSTVLYLIFAGLVTAAELTSSDYLEWTSSAEKAEEILSSGRAYEAVLEKTRSDIADWRTRLEAEQGVNSNRITILKEQLSALGNPPEEGVADPFKERRDELNKQLVEMSAPSARAVEAFYRADGIIKEIDKQLLSRQTTALLSRGQSPFSIEAWRRVFMDVSKTLSNPFSGRDALLALDAITADFRSIIGGLLLALLGGVLAFTGAGFIRARVASLSLEIPRLQVLGEVLQEIVGGLVVPLLSFAFISIGLQSSGLLGGRGDLLMTYLPQYASWFIFAFWTLRRLIAPEIGVLDVSRRFGPLVFLALCLAFAWSYFKDIAAFDFYAVGTKDLIGGIFAIAGGYILFSLCGQFRYLKAEEEGVVIGRSVVSILVTLGKIIAVLTILATIAGFYTFANAILWPYFNTLLTIGFLVALHPILNRAMNAILGRSLDNQSFLSVLLGLFEIALALPLLALTWGFRDSDLSELWFTFWGGVQIGDARLTPLSIVGFFVVFFLGYFVTRFIQTALKHSVLPTTKMDVGAQNAIVSGFGYVGIILAAIVAVSSAGLDLSSLAIVAGALSVGIGFGLQNIVSNFVSGIILLIERPVSEGDWIEVGGQMGYVRNISVRSTRIETFDRSDVIIPNADFVSGVVTNWTRGNTVGRLIVPVGVAYGTDTKKVEGILREIARAHPLVLLNPEPGIVFQGFGADSLDFEIRVILRDVNFMLSVKSEINHEIYRRFKEEGIEIPFAQRDVWIRNPEALNPAFGEGKE
jgi:small-conductance mechanosensitive channel